MQEVPIVIGFTAGELSPWLSACKVGEVYKVPVSHGEGKIVAPLAALEEMKKNENKN